MSQLRISTDQTLSHWKKRENVADLFRWVERPDFRRFRQTHLSIVSVH